MTGYAIGGAVSVLLGAGLIWSLKVLSEALWRAHRAGMRRVGAAQRTWNADYEASMRRHPSVKGRF